MRRLLVAGAMAAMLVTVPFASRGEDANQACSDGQGVTLVVDFQALGGGVNVRCAPQPIANGYDAFRNAHVSYETVSGKDFVCRIAAKPENASCADYPAGDYYWAYYWATPGQDWKYSSKGAGARKPPPGSYEGWSFVSSDTASPPRYPVPPAPTTTTATATASTVAAGAPATATTTTRVRSSPGSAPATTHTDFTTTTSVPEATASTAAETATSLALGHVDLTQTGKGGTSLGFILSGLAVVGLGVLAVAFLRGRGR
ncbi:MAG: hypothetical protein QOK28_2457 [Actinomycetota bacterium]|jgi:hypothetical protein